MSLFRQTISHWELDGRRVPRGTPGAAKVTRKSKKWYGRVGGKKVPLSSNRAAALQLLVQLRQGYDAGDAGRHARERARPLEDHLSDYESELASSRKGKRGLPPTAKYVAEHMSRLRLGLSACKFVSPSDIDLGRVRRYLADRLADGSLPEIPDREWFSLGEMLAILGIREESALHLIRRHGLPWEGSRSHRRYPRETLLALLRNQRKRRGASAGTVATEAVRLRRFTGWLARRCGWRANPLADLDARVSLDTDHRHDRRALKPEEVSALLTATLASPRVLRGLAGRDRHALYLTALATGWRAGELAQTTPRLFRLGLTPPHILLPGAAGKSGKGAEQPLPPDVAAYLQEYLRGKPLTLPLWPGTWADDPAEIVRHDLADAGIPYRIEGPDGPLFADFHALRHTYIKSLDRAGVSLKQAMQLARHSDPRLTARVYGRSDLAELGDAVGRLKLT